MTVQRSLERRPIPSDTFPLRLLIARAHAGLRTAEEAGAAVGVTGQTWLNWEKGAYSAAQRPAMLNWIAEKLDVDVDWLRDGGPLNPDDDDSPPPGPRSTNKYRRGLLQSVTFGRPLSLFPAAA